MAANPQQGTFVATSVAGFTSLVAGLVFTATHTAIGWIVAVVGLALLTMSAAGLYRLKQLEAGK